MHNRMAEGQRVHISFCSCPLKRVHSKGTFRIAWRERSLSVSVDDSKEVVEAVVEGDGVIETEVEGEGVMLDVSEVVE